MTGPDVDELLDRLNVELETDFDPAVAGEFVHDAIAASAAGEGRRLGNRWGGGLEHAPDELVDRALRQTVAAGHGYAAIPLDLVPADEVVDGALRAGRCGHWLVDGGMVLVCLLELDVDGDRPHLAGAGHGWAGREHADALLAAQVDPLERLARRWAHATA